MKVLVTGGAGFIGSWIVDALVKEGHDVIVVDDLSTGKMENVNPKARFYGLNIRSKKILKIFEKEKPDYVFHLAAQINVRESIKDPIRDSEINIIGTLNILNCCVNQKVKKFIFSSTGGAIYGDRCKIPTPEVELESPASPYGIAKLSIEKYLHFYKLVYGLDYVSLRYANVYGPRQNSKGEAGVIAIFSERILDGKEVRINGSGEQKRDYVFVDDVANANILSLNLSGIYNVGTSIETSVNEILSEIKKTISKEFRKVNLPEIKGEQMRSCLSNKKLITAGWNPQHDLKKGIRETVSYFRENHGK